MHVLIAEDDLLILKTLEFRLQKDGYTTHAVQDGEQAINYFKHNKVHLVITDLHMPFVTGLEVLSFVKKLSPIVPVIILTSAGQEHTVSEAFKLGADDFVTKPFSPAELTLRVKRLIKA